MALVLNTWNKLTNVANHAQGSVMSTNSVAIDPSWNGGILRMDCPMTGVAHPFNDPAMVVQVDAYASWDGGVTFDQVYSQSANGSSTGTWGKGFPYPTWGLDVPVDTAGVRADHYRADFTVVAGGPISFGLSLFLD